MAVSTGSKFAPKMNKLFRRKVIEPQLKVNEEMQYEGMRLSSFKNWPKWAAVWPTLLAKAGFFYTKTADQVACFCCSGRLKTWESGDKPMTEHKRFFPQCKFVTGQDVTNVPLGNPPEVPSGSQLCQTSTKKKSYDQQAKIIAAQNSGLASIGHRAKTVRQPRETQYASLQYSANNIAQSGGLSMAAGGLSMAAGGLSMAAGGLSMAAGGLSMAAGGLSMTTGGLSMAAGASAGILSLSLQQVQEMKLESKRLESFANWPSSACVCPEDLAKAGLYYFAIADHVKCAFCNVTLRNWKVGDEPMEVHQKNSKTCAFLKDAKAAGNISNEEEQVNIRQASQNSVANPSPNLGVVTSDVQRSLNYSGEASRLLSFRKWPPNSNQNAEDLAQAGFYYTGIEDSVKCFSCNGTLRSWERGDDAWMEHARWFPRCNYLRAVKGEAFIRTVQASHSGQSAASGTARTSADSVTRTFPVEPRMVRARMDTTRVRSVLDMGFTRDLLYQVIEYRLKTTGDDFPNVQSLLEAVFAAEEVLPSSSSSFQTQNATLSATFRAAEPPAATPAATTPAAAGNQAAAPVNLSPKLSSKAQKRRRKNKSASGNNGSSAAKTSVSASEPSVPLVSKSEEKKTPATAEDQRLQCKICMDAEAKIVFLPCGHLCSCSMCAPALRNCPICRALIRGTVRVFLS